MTRETRLGIFRVVFVEDDSVLARSIAASLREDGFDVDVVRTVGDAIHRVRSERPDAMLVDLGLPDGSGIDLIRRVRAAGWSVPVLVFTARAEATTTVEALEAGADGYLVKPASVESIEARLRALKRRAGGEASPVLRMGGLVLDTDRMAVRRGDAEIDLTPAQVRILEALMQAGGAVMSRDELSEKVHRGPAPPLSNVIDVHVRTLRAKVDEPFGCHSIETVRGVGYRLRDHP